MPHPTDLLDFFLMLAPIALAGTGTWLLFKAFA